MHSWKEWFCLQEPDFWVMNFQIGSEIKWGHFYSRHMDSSKFLSGILECFRIFFWIFPNFWILKRQYPNFDLNFRSSIWIFQNFLSNFRTFFQISELGFPISEISQIFKTKFPNFQQNLVATWFHPNFYRFFSQNFLPIFLPDFLISFFLIVLPCLPIFYGTFINFFQTFPWNLISEFVEQIL